MILPQPRTQFFDTLGRPLTGGLVYTFAQGTTSPKLTYQDRAQTIANANPIVLDASGTALIWGKGAYTISVKTSVGVSVYTGDTTGFDYDPTAVVITGGTIDGSAIGLTTPAAGNFTTLTALGGTIANAALTGIPTAPTAAVGANTTQIASTAFMAAGLAAALVNTNLTGVPLAPTAGAGTNTGQIANTAFVTTALNIVKAASQPIATTVAGLGQLFSVYAAASNAIFLPAGGTWAYFVTGYNSSGAFDTGGSAGVAAGGSQIGAASAGRQYNAMVWKIQ